MQVLCLSVDVETIVIGGGMSAFGPDLLEAVIDDLETRASASAFLSSLAMPGRLRLLPQGAPVGGIGAVLLPVTDVAALR